MLGVLVHLRRPCQFLQVSQTRFGLGAGTPTGSTRHKERRQERQRGAKSQGMMMYLHKAQKAARVFGKVRAGARVKGETHGMLDRLDVYWDYYWDCCAWFATIVAIDRFAGSWN